MLNLVGQHPNVAELIDVFEDIKHVHLVLELCKGGELFDRVVTKGTFTEKMAAGEEQCLQFKLRNMSVYVTDQRPSGSHLIAHCESVTELACLRLSELVCRLLPRDGDSRGAYASAGCHAQRHQARKLSADN